MEDYMVTQSQKVPQVKTMRAFVVVLMVLSDHYHSLVVPLTLMEVMPWNIMVQTQPPLLIASPFKLLKIYLY